MENQLYYALVSGHELIADENIFWSYYPQELAYDKLLLRDRTQNEHKRTKLTALEWESLGIFALQAQYVEVEKIDEYLENINKGSV